MRLRWAVVVLTAVAVLTGLAVAWVARPLPRSSGSDVTLLNDLSAQAASSWPTVGAGSFDAAEVGDVAFAVVDDTGRVRYRQGDAPTSVLAATTRGGASLPVVVDGRQVGTVVIAETTQGVAWDRQRQRCSPRLWPGSP